MGAGEVGVGEGERGEEEGREGGERRGRGGATDREGLETQTRMTATWRQPFEQPGPSPLHKQTVPALLLLLRSSCLPPSYPPPAPPPPHPPHPIQRPSHAFPSTKPSLFLLSHLLIIFSFPRLFFNQPLGPSLLFIHCTDEACGKRELVS